MQISGANYYGPYQLPTMSETVKGGALLGSGLEIDSDTLSIDLTDSATGESITADDASYLASLTVDGKAVQDGTPTPDSPVPVQVVGGRNLAKPYVFSSSQLGVSLNYAADGSITVVGTATGDIYAPTASTAVEQGFVYVLPAGTYTLSYSGNLGTMVANVANSSGSNIAMVNENTQTATFTLTEATSVFHRITVPSSTTANTTIHIQLEAGTHATPYTPYGCIGLQTGETVVPIDLQGNVLASLPDGTKDVLTVDSVGHVVMEKNTSTKVLDGSESWNYYAPNFAYTAKPSGIASGEGSTTANILMTDRFKVEQSTSGGNCYISGANILFYKDSYYNPTSSAEAKTWATTNNITLLYKLATPQTIDLGYIDMPAIPDGATISITAQVTPTITASWWARGAAAIAEAFAAVCARIDAIEAAIAELATA